MSGGSQQDYSGLLAALLQRPEVRGTWYNRKVVKLDGYRFVSCRFDNCTLEVSSTNFELERCYIDSTTVVRYSGDIVKPIRLFNRVYDWIYQQIPYFAPVRHEDGTITIKM